MPDRDMIIRGCEYWIKNHKGEQLILKYSAVEDLLALLKEQEHKDKMFRALEEDWKRLKEQEPVRCKDCKWYDERISLCDNCGLPREQTFFCADGIRRE